MIVIGITGTLGAGKGTVVDYLVSEKKFIHFSVRKYLAEVILQNGQEVNRDTLTHTANALREKFGPGHIIDEIYKLALQSNHNCVIESIRTPGEIESLRRHKGFVLLAVDADVEVRYNRIVIRNSETDRIDFETFVSNEKREMHSSDPNKQNLSQCIKHADFVIDNNGNMEELHKSTASIIEKIQKQHELI